MTARIHTAVVALALALTASAASAQTSTATSTAPAAQGTVVRQTASISVRTDDGKTLLGYANADPLHGLYTRKPLVEYCGNTPLGPLQTPEQGSLESQPGYNFMIDFDTVGGSCRHGI